jgi:hypothetical protein
VIGWIARCFVSCCFGSLTTCPPPPPWVLGIKSLGAPDYPPSTCDMRKGVRVVRRIQLLDPVRGRRRADRGHEMGLAERSEVGH